MRNEMLGGEKPLRTKSMRGKHSLLQVWNHNVYLFGICLCLCICIHISSCICLWICIHISFCICLGVKHMIVRWRYGSSKPCNWHPLIITDKPCLRGMTQNTPIVVHLSQPHQTDLKGFWNFVWSSGSRRFKNGISRSSCTFLFVWSLEACSGCLCKCKWCAVAIIAPVVKVILCHKSIAMVQIILSICRKFLFANLTSPLQ